MSVKQGLMQDLFRYGIDEKGQIRNEKTHKFKDTKLGRIPVEWNVGFTNDLMSYVKSGLSRAIQTEDIGIPVITSTNLISDSISFKELKYWYLKDPQGSNVKSYYLDNGDILLNFINFNFLTSTFRIGISTSSPLLPYVKRGLPFTVLEEYKGYF